MRGTQLLLLGALTAGSVAALLGWSRHLPKTPQVALAAFAGAALLVAVLDVHFAGRTRGDIQDWVAVVAVALAVLGGGPATVAVFTLVDRSAAPTPPRSPPSQQPAQAPQQTPQAAPEAAPEAPPQRPPNASAPAPPPDAVGEGLRGGAWIGALERLAIVTTLVAGWPEGMAVVLAVKALGRYPELRVAQRQGAAEGFIIGTLVSILWAVACAYVITGGLAPGARILAP